MGLPEILLISVSLAMDAFAASISKGLSMRKIIFINAFIVAVFFGGFQALMPVLGWLFGKQFEKYILDYDHWFAFILLSFIGGKMIVDVIRGDNTEDCNGDKLNLKNMLILAIATSIDALAVGVTFAFLKTPILTASLIIGAVTFIISFAGVLLGCKCGKGFRSKAEIAGGIILIVIGTKILLEHLGIIELLKA